MWLKIIIVLLFISLLISLATSFSFLVKDKGTTHRTWNTLSVRLILATLLIGFLAYGLYTGQLGSNAPWDARYADQSTPAAPVATPPADLTTKPE